MKYVALLLGEAGGGKGELSKILTHPDVSAVFQKKYKIPLVESRSFSKALFGPVVATMCQILGPEGARGLLASRGIHYNGDIPKVEDFAGDDPERNKNAEHFKNVTRAVFFTPFGMNLGDASKGMDPTMVMHAVLGPQLFSPQSEFIIQDGVRRFGDVNPLFDYLEKGVISKLFAIEVVADYEIRQERIGIDAMAVANMFGSTEAEAGLVLEMLKKKHPENTIVFENNFKTLEDLRHSVVKDLLPKLLEKL